MTAPSLESWFEVQLRDAELAALDADLAERLDAALARQIELNEYVRDYIALHGEAGRLELQAQFEPYREAHDRMEQWLEAQLAEIRKDLEE